MIFRGPSFFKALPEEKSPSLAAEVPVSTGRCRGADPIRLPPTACLMADFLSLLGVPVRNSPGVRFCLAQAPLGDGAGVEDLAAPPMSRLTDFKLWLAQVLATRACPGWHSPSQTETASAAHARFRPLNQLRVPPSQQRDARLTGLRPTRARVLARACAQARVSPRRQQ